MPDKHTRAAWGAARKGGGEGGAADREGAGRREEGVGNGCVCLPGACGIKLKRGLRFTVTVKPPKGVRSAGNLAGCVGRSRLRNGHESFRFVRNGLESFL